MKCSIIIFIATLFFAFQGNTQELTIIYEYMMTKHPDMILEEIPEMAQSDIRQRYSLVIHEDISRFSRDSLYIASYPEGNWKAAICSRSIYKNHNEDSWILESGDYQRGSATAKKLSYISENINFDWEISKEEKEIFGVKCIKAVSRNGATTAWHAPGLPYADGPGDGVFNLPGLVLHVETPNEKWEAKGILFHSPSIEIPAFNLFLNDNKIKVSWNELGVLGIDRVIWLDKTTPRGEWISFIK